MRPLPGRGVVVVAAAPVRVARGSPRAAARTTRSAPPTPPPGWPGGTAAATRSGSVDRPLERPHAAHRAADDARPPLDAERVGERRLDRDLVADRDAREARAPRASRPGAVRRRARSSLAAAEHVRAHDEQAVGVDRATRARSRPSHQPGVGCPGPAGPAAWLSPVSACSTSTALDASGASVPHVSYATVTAGQLAAGLERQRLGRAVTNCRRPGGSPARHAPVTGGSAGLDAASPSGRPWRRGSRLRGRP